MNTNILSVGWRSNVPGGFVMTYLEVLEAWSASRSRYL